MSHLHFNLAVGIADQKAKQSRVRKARRANLQDVDGRIRIGSRIALMRLVLSPNLCPFFPEFVLISANLCYMISKSHDVAHFE